MESTYLAAVRAADDLRACYVDFVRQLSQTHSSRLGEAIGFFFRGQGASPSALALEEMLSAAAQQVARLAGLLAACSPQQADELAAPVLEQMLFYPRPEDSTTEFSLVALEAQAQPLLPFLSPARRQDMACRYAKRTPPRRMLPNQKQLWKALSQQ